MNLNSPSNGRRASGHLSAHWLCLALLLLTAGSLTSANYVASSVTPPKVLREFRGAWVATVANIDWPSKPGLSTAEQKAELVSLLDRAARLKLNAIIFQVRPACDALYASKLEPWSEFLTGTMGRAPEPFYDPLAFAIEEAHKRGLELHAWFNPYRALHFSSKSPVASNHISRTRPDLVRRYGKYLWLDPGERDVQDHTLAVVMDVVKRYDVDGIHFDDYFYQERADAGTDADFPDDASWKKYGGRTGLSRADWRRENVNGFIERAYRSIKASKPWVKFGISPFGIWRPGYPPQVRGKDAFATRFADSRKWLAKGWVDYFSPQLYWPIGGRDQSFTALLDWWDEQNIKDRHVWPGLYTVKAAEDWRASEIPNQIHVAARQPVSAGHVHYDLKALVRNADLCSTLERGAYMQPALVPASPWLGRGVTNRPEFFLSGMKSGDLRFTIKPAKGEDVARWALQTRVDGKWKTELLNGGTRAYHFDGAEPEVIAVTAVDRFGNSGTPVVMQKEKEASHVENHHH